MDKYVYDIAISLCKDDVEFARKLVRVINPGLKVFFYETSQEELITKSGPEAFARVFKEQSRVVVILSRSAWSESFYTEIERNAIIDKVKSDGFGFMVVMPMVQDEIPPWYPSTLIYANPFRFSIEELAHFIEFKVVELGGVMKRLTAEDRYQNLIERIDQKKSLIILQQSKEAILSAINEISKLKSCFNEKSDYLSKNVIDRVESYVFREHVDQSYFGLGEYLLKCQIIRPFAHFQIVTTQDFLVTFEILQILRSNENRKLVQSEERVYLYSEKLTGWAVPDLFEEPTTKQTEILFRNRDSSQFYDLIKLERTHVLVDEWFQKLLYYSTQAIQKYI